LPQNHNPKATEMILYGLPTCSDCKAALKAFGAARIDVSFRDVRADPLSEAEWVPLINEFDGALIDRKSQAFRNLNAFVRESEVDAQLAAVPALMVRPVITDGTRYTMGWDDEIQAGWGA
jgi:arsenate reductase-like glutaredoxin family protein